VTNTLDVGISHPQGRAWSLGVNNPGSDAQTFEVAAVCWKHVTGGFTISTSAVGTAGPHVVTAWSQPCPAGDHVAGGGFTTSTTNPVGSVMYFSYPSGSSWTSSFYDGSTNAVSVDAGAVCL